MIEQYLRSLSYNPDTGELSGDRLRFFLCGGSRGSGEYLAFQWKRKTFYVHRVAFFLSNGYWPEYVDHINGNKLDNRLVNLREASMAQNKANEGLRSTNTSGLKGVSRHKSARKWRAVIGNNIHLGLFDCPAAAHFAYIVAADKRYNAFARGR